MSQQTQLAAAQYRTEQRMVDTVLIRRKSTQQELDPETGELDYTWTTVYEGKSRLAYTSAVVRDIDAQSQILAVQQPRLDVPARVTGIEADDEFQITASLDPESVNVRGRIAGRFDPSFKTARRLPVEVWS